MARKSLPSPAKIRADALALYDAESAESGSTILSPIVATKTLAKTYGYGTDAVASPVASVYYRENGTRNPLPVAAGSSPAKIVAAIRVRRDSPETNAKMDATLGRWETIAAAAASALGVRFSAKRAKGLYLAKYGESYVGRGTFAAAPSLRGTDA